MVFGAQKQSDVNPDKHDYKTTMAQMSQVEHSCSQMNNRHCSTDLDYQKQKLSDVSKIITILNKTTGLIFSKNANHVTFVSVECPENVDAFL